MNKIIAIILASVLMLSLAGCRINIHGILSDLPTAPASDKETEAPSEAATEAPTEAPAEVAPAGYYIFTDKGENWQVYVPEVWRETGIIVEYDDGGTRYSKFCYKEAYNDGAGHVFTIATCTDPADFVDVSEFPYAEQLYKSGDIQIYAVFPTDVQFGVFDDPSSSEFKKQQKEYSELYETRQEILDSFKLL